MQSPIIQKNAHKKSYKDSLSFADRVNAAVAGIPRGKVASYGEIARRAGSPGAARAVGTVMSHNSDYSSVPCHRVVRGDRVIGAYNAGGAQAKIKKLRSEGVVVEDGKVLEEQML